MRPDLNSVIKNEIEFVFGRRVVSSRDCIELSEAIFNRTQHQLNPNTLRRFFGLVKANYAPSQSTLTILSKYCGFNSVEDVYNVKQEKDNPELIEPESLLHYFVSIFEETRVDEYCDRTFLSMVKHTVLFLDSHPFLADKFQNLISKTKNGQEFYFERFVQTDKLNSYYEKGLRYYLNEKQAPASIIFANSVLILKHWLNGNRDKVNEYAEVLLEHKSPELKNPHIDPRYFASLLFYADVNRITFEETLVDIYQFHTAAVQYWTHDELFYFEYVLSEALTLTGHYPDALFYISQFEKRSQKNQYCALTISFENLKLLKSLCQYKEKDSTAQDTFVELDPSGFHFTSKRFMGTLYMYLSNVFKRKSEKYTESFNDLVVQTGFERLQTAL